MFDGITHVERRDHHLEYGSGSSSQMEYGITTSHGSMTTLDPTLVTSHSQALAGLLAATTYHYRVHSTNASGAQGISGDFHFTTLAARSRHLQCFSGIDHVQRADHYWTTDQASSSQVGIRNHHRHGSMTTVDPTLVTSHSQALTAFWPRRPTITASTLRMPRSTQGISGDFTSRRLPCRLR